MESARPERRHPLEVKPLSSNARFKQSRYDIFNPLPCKAYYVSSSGGGKSSAAISLIENLLPLFQNFAVFSHTIKVDPSFDGLLAKIKRRKLGEERAILDEELGAARAKLGWVLWPGPPGVGLRPGL